MRERTTSLIDERLAAAPAGTLRGVAADAPVPARAGLRPAAAGRHLDLAALRAAAQREAARGNGFLWLPVFMAGGALAYFALAREPGFVPLVFAVVATFLLAALNRARPVLRAGLIAALAFAGGALAAKVETWRAGTLVTGSEISTRVTGRVMRIEHQTSGRVRLTLDILATERPVLRYAPARARLSARSVPDGLEPGDMVEGVARLLSPSGPVRPQSYDFAFRSYFTGIGASGFFLMGPERAAVQEPAGLGIRAAAWMERWRARMADRIATRIGGAEGAIAAALITGIRAGIPEEVNEALRITGLYHVISISGLHMALVGGTVLLAVRFGFALAPAFSARRPVKKYAALAALGATGFYLLMSGGDVAAQRSFLMLAVMLIAVLFDRAALTMRNLAISAILIILVTPHEVVGPSFQMSFAATAALVAAYGAWSEFRAGRNAGAPFRERKALSPAGLLLTGAKYAGGLALTSVVAGAATALFTAWHFQQISPLGLVANLTAMPFVSVVVMPMAVVAALLMPLGLEGPALDLMGWGIAAMNAVAFRLAAMSAYDATGTIPLAAVLSLTAALAVLTMSTSLLRLAAVPFLVVGVALLAMRQSPDLLVSEDGRLLAMRLTSGQVSVNRDRPRAFVMQNWLRAFDAEGFVRPQKAPPDFAAHGESGFSCEDGLCAARHESGAWVVHAADAGRAADACGHASVIVIDDATASDPCADAGTIVLTKRELARRGSAEIVFAAPASGAQLPAATLRFAIPEPYRPWHDHRRFSREARGLAPYRKDG